MYIYIYIYIYLYIYIYIYIIYIYIYIYIYVYPEAWGPGLRGDRGSGRAAAAVSALPAHVFFST